MIDGEKGSPELVAEEIWRIPWWLKLGGMAGWYALGLAAILLIFFALVSTAATLVIPLLFAAILGAVFSPAVERLADHGVKRWVAALLVLFAVILAGAALVALVVVGIIQQWPEISAQFTATMTKIYDTMHQTSTDSTVQQATDTIAAGATKAAGGVVSSIPQILQSVFAIGFALFLGANILFFMLKDGGRIGDAVARHMFVGETIARKLLHDAGVTMRSYMLGVGMVATFNALVVGVGAALLGVPLAGTIAVVTFVFAFIPYFGAVVSGAFAVVMALSSGGVGDAAIMLVIVVLANGVLQTMVNMYAMNATLSLDPLLVLVITTVGGLWFGALGAFLAAPVASILARAANDFDDAGLFDLIQEKGQRIAGGLEQEPGAQAPAQVSTEDAPPGDPT